jgi:Raf kinase inhibitor-like YbhB/YbcL family protein
MRLFLVLIAQMIYLFMVGEHGLHAAQSQESAKAYGTGGMVMKIKLNSAAFGDGNLIPKKYTCDGADISPPIAWESVPEGTQSFALISDDPDAPVGTWVHWVMYNIPATARALPEAVPAREKLDDGARQGTNDFRRIGYGGPCPPSGTHRYYFKLYALDTKLSLEPGITKMQLEKAMDGHILGEGRLMGKYKR